MKKLFIFLSLSFLLANCAGDVTEITNRDNKVIGTYKEYQNYDVLSIVGHNPVDVEYAFKTLKDFNKDISDSFKQKLINVETGVWIFKDTRIMVSYGKENLIVRISDKNSSFSKTGDKDPDDTDK